MADLNIALILRLVDRATGPARAAFDRMDRMSQGALTRNAAIADRGARLMAGGMGDVARGAGRAALAVGAYGGVMAGIGLAFVRPAAQMERFKVQLKNLEGSSAGAERAMAWIQEFATRTPLELNDTISAYARLKAFGVDPMNGSLQALVDTMAASGGGAEQLDGLVLALGQSWTKGKLQGEEALQMLERGVPVWDLLAAKLGRTAAEMQEMASAGKLGRTEIQLLVDALAERNKGASEAMSKTWDGIISNLIDHWSRWQVMVMDAGLFDFLKGKLQLFLDFLNQAAADGRLQRWAEQTAGAIMWALEGIWAMGVEALALWQQVYPWLEAAAEWTGGWQNLLIAITALAFGKTILGMVMGLAKLTVGLGLVSGGFLGLVKDVGKLTLSQRILVGFGRVLAVLGRALFLTPLGLAIAAVATGVYAIYENWDGIVTWFQGKIERVRAAFDEGFFQGLWTAFKEFNPTTLVVEALAGFVTYVNDKIEEAFGVDLLGAGDAMVKSMWDGIRQAWTDVLDWFRRIPDMIVAAIGRIDIGSLITWPEPPAWLDRLWNGDTTPAGQQAAMARRAPSLAYGQEATPYAGPRALGGPVRAGHVYRWLEEGQEMFVLNADGQVISNRQLRAMRQRPASPAGSRIDVGGITINAAPGMDARDIAREVGRVLRRLDRDGRAALHDGGAYA
ncbi:tail tape measure protein [Paracoccus sediminis]|uniref:Tail tape measure protein n=1 Tax=Paracoccus sediminis TaxID=1214787 RepID=A0A238ULA9_9RHOB|nr:tape measure protein [Paracoccus sediminis]TBN53145.1 tail tape measure protein [Paracoccus sediminis]SNR22815.1 tape measure domain-containing protein [Paracoccus sediminis]